MAYMVMIAKASQKYQWPAWIIYDQHFRVEATAIMGEGDPSLFDQCFTGQARVTENWCTHCIARRWIIPLSQATKKIMRGSVWASASTKAVSGFAANSVCLKFNRRFQHSAVGVEGRIQFRSASKAQVASWRIIVDNEQLTAGPRGPIS